VKLGLFLVLLILF